MKFVQKKFLITLEGMTMKFLHPWVPEILEKMRQDRKKRWTPNISDDTGKYLYEYIRSHGYKDVLELWSANGYSTLYLADAVADRGGHVMSIEIQKESYEAAKEHLGWFSHVTLIRSNILDFLPSLEDFLFDCIFIDAKKTETLAYFRGVLPHLRTNGTIIIDDIVKYREKMEDFYDFLLKYHIAYEIVMTDEDDGIMVITHQNLENKSFSL